jgi:hypothetical protein
MPFLSDLRALVLAGIAVLCLLVAGVQTVRLNGLLWIDGALDKVEELRRDNNELRAAAREAERLNREQVERITNDQEQITDEVSRDLNSRLERLRRELRDAQAARLAKRAGSGPVPTAPGGADEEAGLCLAPDELLRAAENEERHDQLITWLEKQLGVAR